MYRTRLSCRVLKKLRAYKRDVPMIEAVESTIEPDNRIEVVNTIKKEPKPIYSIKIQIQEWILDITELINTGCSSTILDKK